MKDIKNYIILALTILAIILFSIRSCETTPTKIETRIITKERIDTVFAKDTIITFKYKTVSKPVSYIRDTFTNIDSSACQYIRVYNDSLVDSNLVLYYKDTVKGVLLGTNLSYKLKIPIKITHTIENYTDNTPRRSLEGGLLVGGNKTQFDFNVALKLNTNYSQNGYVIMYNPINQTVQLGYTRRLFRSKQRIGN